MNIFSDKNILKYSEVYKTKLDFTLFYLCTFDNSLKLKKSIEVNPIEKIKKDAYPRFKKCSNGTYDIYYKKTIKIANCKYDNNKIYDIRLYIDSSNRTTDNPNEVFNLKDCSNGTIKYFLEYYEMIDKETYFNEENFVKKRSFSKYTAMRFYLIVKKAFEENAAFYKQGYVISEPNVFIKEYSIEYDLLILNKNIPINQGIYDKKDVMATIELKSSPIWNNSQTIIDYLKEEMYPNYKKVEKPHIYITSYSKLQVMKDISKINNIIPFSFVCFDIQGKNRKYYFDNDYKFNDISNIIKKITDFYKKSDWK